LGFYLDSTHWLRLTKIPPGLTHCDSHNGEVLTDVTQKPTPQWGKSWQNLTGTDFAHNGSSGQLCWKLFKCLLLRAPFGPCEAVERNFMELNTIAQKREVRYVWWLYKSNDFNSICFSEASFQKKARTYSYHTIYNASLAPNILYTCFIFSPDTILHTQLFS
jgi:hypothetical protein